MRFAVCPGPEPGDSPLMREIKALVLEGLPPLDPVESLAQIIEFPNKHSDARVEGEDSAFKPGDPVVRIALLLGRDEVAPDQLGAEGGDGLPTSSIEAISDVHKGDIRVGRHVSRVPVRRRAWPFVPD